MSFAARDLTLDHAGDLIESDQMRRIISQLATISLLLTASAGLAEPLSPLSDPVFPPAMRALFDMPTEALKVALPPNETGESNGVVRCFRYPGLTVHEVDYGEHGDDSIFVTAHEAGKSLPSCGPVPGRLEKTLFDSEQSYFVGAEGPFGFVVSTLGHDGTPFTIHNLADNLGLYGDELANDTSPLRFEVAANVLKLEYVRAAKGSCSILNGGSACWKAFAIEAELPPAIANAPPPTTLCAKGYAAAFGRPANANGPSVLTYTVYVEINAGVEVEKMIRPGALVSCNPQS